MRISRERAAFAGEQKSLCYNDLQFRSFGAVAPSQQRVPSGSDPQGIRSGLKTRDAHKQGTRRLRGRTKVALLQRLAIPLLWSCGAVATTGPRCERRCCGGATTVLFAALLPRTCCDGATERDARARESGHSPRPKT